MVYANFSRLLIAGLLCAGLASPAFAEDADRQARMSKPFDELTPGEKIAIRSAAKKAYERKDLRTLRVCADPGNMPLSSEEKEGFQNKIADILGDALNAKVTYYWRPSTERRLLGETLHAARCDVMFDMPEDYEGTVTTEPLYRSTYVLAYPKNADFELEGLDDPKLKDLKIAVSQVSAARQALQKRGDFDTLVQPQRYDGYRVIEHQPWYVVQWVLDGKADVAAVWGPFAGWVDTIKGEPLDLVPINLDEDRYPLEFSLALAVRPTDVFLKYLLEFALEDNKDKIEAVLREYGVPLVQCSRCIIAGDLPSHGSYTAIPQSEFKARPELATPDQVVTTDEVAQALEKGADPTEELFNAVIGGDEKRVEFLLSKGADINALDSNGSAPIHLAAMGKQREMVAFLIEKGANVDRADNAGMTPLLYAAMRDDIPTAKLLIEKGANVDQASNEGFTPLTLAIEEQRYEAAKLLIESGADVKSAVGEQKLTPLMITAARMGPAEGSVFLPSSTRPIDIARMLIERGADVNAQSSTGMTPLMIAAARDNAPVIGLLLQKGAEPDLKNSGGQTALQIAELNDAKSAIQAINVLSRAFGNKRAQSDPAEPTAKP